MISVPWYPSQVGKMLDLANKNIGYPVKFEFHINSLFKYVLNIVWDILILKNYLLFI